MNVTVIYGSIRKTNTYNCVQLLLDNLRVNINIKVTEFFLPKDYFCYEYMSCSKNNVKIYDNTTDIDYIVRYLDNSDLIILASSVSTCDISREMKLLLNSLSKSCILNNVSLQMSNKIGLALTTSAGAGLFYTTRTLKKNLNFLGINNTFKFSKTLYEANWGDVSLKMKSQINKKIIRLSCKILNLYNEINTINSSVFINKTVFTEAKYIFKLTNCNLMNINCLKNQICLRCRNIL